MVSKLHLNPHGSVTILTNSAQRKWNYIASRLLLFSCKVVSASFCNHRDCSLLGSSVHRISRQEPWSGLPFRSQGIVPTQGLNSSLLHCRRIFLLLSYQGSPQDSGKKEMQPPAYLWGYLQWRSELPNEKFNYSKASTLWATMKRHHAEAL